MGFTIYHTCASAPDLGRARDAAPSFEHGFGWTPDKMAAHDDRYFLDNGGYQYAQRGELPTFTPFLQQLADVPRRMPRDPDFVVLPDTPQDVCATLEMSYYFLDNVRAFGYDYYLPYQSGCHPHTVAFLAERYGASGIFIGGGSASRTDITRVLKEARERELKVHVGKPGMDSLTWLNDLGVDSIDTSTIVRNNYWHHLKKLEVSAKTVQAELV